MRKASRGFVTLLAFAGVCLAGSGYLNARSPQTPPPAAPAAEPTAQAADIINRYCVTCHNSRLNTAGLALDRLDLRQVSDNGQQWEKVVTKLRTGEMPPPGRPRPDAPAYRAAAAALEHELDRAAAVKPHPGRVPVHRLNR